MSELRWYEKHGWLLFVLISIFGVVMAVQIFAAPESAHAIFAHTGYPVPESILTDVQESIFINFVFRWIGTVLMGGNLLTLFIAFTAFRQGEKWAWFAFLYWPTMFASHLLIYGDGFLKGLQIFWLVSTLLVLGSNYRRFFHKRSRTIETAVA